MKTVTVEYTANILTTKDTINRADIYTVDNIEIGEIDRIITDIGALEIKLYGIRPNSRFPPVNKTVLYAPKVWKRVITS